VDWLELELELERGKKLIAMDESFFTFYFLFSSGRWGCLNIGLEEGWILRKLDFFLSVYSCSGGLLDGWMGWTVWKYRHGLEGCLLMTVGFG